MPCVVPEQISMLCLFSKLLAKFKPSNSKGLYNKNCKSHITGVATSSYLMVTQYYGYCNFLHPLNCSLLLHSN